MLESVSERARSVKQPRGGYVKPSQFEVLQQEDPVSLNPEENIAPNIVGMAVDYLTRYFSGKDKEDAFVISLDGARIAEELGAKNALKIASRLLDGINDLDDNTVINACKLVSFDIWKRNPLVAPMQKTYRDINPDQATIDNIQRMVQRGVVFFEEFGPVTCEGFTFEPPEGTQEQYEKMLKTGKGTFGGYTPTVASGDGDFLTEYTLWDFKVSKNKPTSRDTLQLLMYWIMGQHSGQECFQSIISVGLYNPRLNVIHVLDLRSVPEETIHAIETEVIGYD